MSGKLRRWENGGGLVEDWCEVSRHVWVDRTSAISDQATVVGRVRLNNHSHIFGNALVAGDARLYRATIGTHARVYDHAAIAYATIRGMAVVCGNATLYGDFEVNQAMRVHEGLWKSAPHYIDSTFAQMTECIDGKVIIGCQCRPVDWWIEHRAAMGRMYGWTRAQVEECRERIEEFR